MKTKIKALALLLTVTMLLGAVSGMEVSAVETGSKPDMAANGLTQESIDASLLSMGNTAYIRNVFKKADAGETVTIAALGGSITYGSGMVGVDGTQADTYLSLVCEWFRTTFPQATVKEVNTALPATGSFIGNINAADNLWQHNPDLLFIEYAVNEGATPFTEETCEALFRRALSNHCAVCYFFMSKPDGWNSQEEKRGLGSYYGLPMVSYLSGMRKLFKQGESFKPYDADGTHPNKKGQAAAALYIINWLETALKEYDGKEQPEPALPARKYADAFDYCRGLYSSFYVPTSFGSFTESIDACLYGPFKQGWQVTDGGQEPIVFEVEAKRVYVPVRANPSIDGRALIMVNGVPVTTVNSYYQWDTVRAPLVFESDTTKKVTISIKLIGGRNFFLSGLWICY